MCIHTRGGRRAGAAQALRGPFAKRYRWTSERVHAEGVPKTSRDIFEASGSSLVP